MMPNITSGAQIDNLIIILHYFVPIRPTYSGGNVIKWLTEISNVRKTKLHGALYFCCKIVRLPWLLDFDLT